MPNVPPLCRSARTQRSTTTSARRPRRIQGPGAEQQSRPEAQTSAVAIGTNGLLYTACTAALSKRERRDLSGRATRVSPVTEARERPPSQRSHAPPPSRRHSSEALGQGIAFQPSKPEWLSKQQRRNLTKREDPANRANPPRSRTRSRRAPSQPHRSRRQEPRGQGAGVSARRRGRNPDRQSLAPRQGRVRRSGLGNHLPAKAAAESGLSANDKRERQPRGRNGLAPSQPVISKRGRAAYQTRSDSAAQRHHPNRIDPTGCLSAKLCITLAVVP